MLRCPHCGDPGLRVIDKLLSDYATPARCKLCGQLSCKTTFITYLLRLTATPAFAVGGYFAFINHSWWPLALVVLLPVFGYAIALAVPATPVSVAQERRARAFSNWALIVLVVLVILAGVLHQ